MQRTREDTPLFSPSRSPRFPFFRRVCIYRSDRVTSSFRLCSFADRTQGVSLWLPFQTAAGTVTSLYKGACTSLVSCQQCEQDKPTFYLSLTLSLFLFLRYHPCVGFPPSFCLSLFFIHTFAIPSSLYTAITYTHIHIHIHTTYARVHTQHILHTCTYTYTHPIHIDNVFACTCTSERFAQLTNAEGQLLIDANFQDYYEYL